MAGGGTKLAVLGRPGAGALAVAGSALGVGVSRGLALDGSLDEAGGQGRSWGLGLGDDRLGGGLQSHLGPHKVGGFFVGLAVVIAVAAILLSWIVVREVALGTEPGDGHLLATNKHDRWPPSFLDNLRKHTCRS